MSDAETQRLLPGIATELRAAMDEAGVSGRELGRRLSDGTPKRAEIERRNVNRWLAGTTPSRQKARQLAKALKLPPETFLRQRQDAAALLEQLEARVAELEAELRRLQADRHDGRVVQGGGRI